MSDSNVCNGLSNRKSIVLKKHDVLELLARWLILIAVVTPSVTAAQSAEDVLLSSLVFRGTVTKVEASTLQLVPASPNTIVVKVDLVFRTTDVSSDYTNREVTVYVKDPSALKPGDKAVFFTQGWMLEDGVGLKEVSHAKVTATGALDTSLKKMIASAIQQEDNKLFQERTANANLVVEGQVISTERVDILPAAGGEGGIPLQMVFSEHNPLLKKAVIQVSKAYADTAGETPQLKTVTVIYASSQDLAWADAPKFEVGDKGLFVLKRAQSNLEIRDFLKNVNGRIDGLDRNYVGPNPLDFFPKSEIERIRPLIKPTVPQLNP
ncbi:MAG TPA: hypothetical protein VLL54_15035 [Pyrinomonadaceae bacterium]|nr:hypothetical protein [Pyrinomonadaceae bacterium]